MSLPLPLLKSQDGVEADLRAVDACLHDCLASEVPLIPQVGAYLLDSGGKRIRPLLHILAARLCGYEGEDHIEVGAALELIHTATLLHDDVVDQAKLRRGRPAAQTIWNNQTSVLVGDFLFSKSFVLMCRVGDLRVMRIVSEVCTRMAEGEALQLTVSQAETNRPEDYLSVIRDKTAILFSAACRLGAVLAVAGPRTEKAMQEFGEAIGMAFQVSDDALDYSADPDRLGKAIGKDLEEGKITLPLIESLKAAPPNRRPEILDLIGRFSRRHEAPTLEDLGRVLSFVREHDGVRRALAVADLYAQAARRALTDFSASPEKESMVSLTEFVVRRNH